MSDNDVGAVETWQDIQISAGSVKTLREIYAKIRSGYLKPAEDWGTPLEDFVAVGVMLRLMAMTGRI